MMNKKDLKWYETPAMEVVELKINAQLLAGSGDPKENPFSDSTYEGGEDE